MKSNHSVKSSKLQKQTKFGRVQWITIMLTIVVAGWGAGCLFESVSSLFYVVRLESKGALKNVIVQIIASLSLRIMTMPYNIF